MIIDRPEIGRCRLDDLSHRGPLNSILGKQPLRRVEKRDAGGELGILRDGAMPR
jgi:hypothetical protein